MCKPYMIMYNKKYRICRSST